MHSIKPSFDRVVVVVVRWPPGPWPPDVVGCLVVFVFELGLILLKLMSARFMLPDFKLLSEVIGELSFPAR